MLTKSLSGITLVAVVGLLLSMPVPVEASPKLHVLHRFHGMDGNEPYSGLVAGRDGSVYGTTLRGGAYGVGSVFSLTPSVSGGWTEKLLHSFKGAGDGSFPEAALAMDTYGNLYGTATDGGLKDCAGYGCGVVFELSPKNGHWQYKVIHSFHGSDGQAPNGVILDGTGDLYGTTYAGETSPGFVFRLSFLSDGKWKYEILHRFRDNHKDGFEPLARVTLGPDGCLYGTTLWGGTHGWGVVYKVSADSKGQWHEKVLYNFSGNSNATSAPVILDNSRNLYGVTYGDGKHGAGSIFELSGDGGRYHYKDIFSFGADGRNGCCLVAGLIFDSQGSLYGTTLFGGIGEGGCQPFGCGEVFRLTYTPGDRKWRLQVLHAFSGGPDGGIPVADLIFDSLGRLYGTASEGGDGKCPGYPGGCGVVFEIIPE